MSTPSPSDARADLARATSLTTTARRSSAYAANYFAAWALGSVVMGAGMFLLPLLDNPAYLTACLAAWVCFLVALLVFFYRGRRTRPHHPAAIATGIVGGTVPWALAAAVQPLTARQVWWLAGAPFLAACLLAAASMIRGAAR